MLRLARPMLPLLLISLASDATPLEHWATTGDTALTNTRQAAEALAATAERIAATGRIRELPALRTDSETLVRRAQALERLTQESPPD